MIRIEYDRHEVLLRLFAGTDEVAESDNLRENGRLIHLLVQSLQRAEGDERCFQDNA